MISISSGPPPLDKTQSGGEAYDLMVALLRARLAADTSYSLAKQAEQGRYPFLAKFWNEVAELQTEILRRAATAVDRIKEESREGVCNQGELITDAPKTKYQRESDPKGGA